MPNPVVRRIVRIGRRRGAPRKHILAALTTGRVESNFRNLPGGDADSQGWRQERASLYANPRNLRASINRFYNEAAQHDRGQSAGELAADVQRPAAQYRGRYAQHLGEAKQILSGQRGIATGGRVSGFRPARAEIGTQTVFDQAGYETAQRRARVAQFLQKSGRGNSVLFRSGLLSAETPDPSEFTSTSLKSRLISGTVPRSIRGAGGVTYGNSPTSVISAVRAARSKLGIKEIGTSNRSREVDAMSKSFGMVGVPWCGIFVGTVLREAGVKGITSRVASVAAIEQDAKRGANGFDSWHSPRSARKGDALVTNSGGHVVFVTKVDRKRGVIHTIGGNSSGKVQRVTYRMGDVVGAARPRYRR